MRWTIKMARGAAWSAVSVVVLLLLIATPVDRTPIDGTAYRSASLEALGASLATLSDSPAPAQLLAGVARRPIRPPLEWNVPLAGNRGLRFTRAEGSRPESVWGRALALRQGERRFILVSADIMVIHPFLGRRVLERVRQVEPIEADELLLVAAHTHSGPGGYWRGALAEQSVGPYDERVLDFLVEQLAGVAIEAWDRLAPARVGMGSRAMPLTVKNRAYKRGPENPQLGLLRFEALDGSFSVDVVNYAAHPTILLRGNALYSGDYPALMAAELDGPRRTMIFIPGSIGDSKPSFDGVRDPEVRASSIARHLVTRGVATIEVRWLDPVVVESFEFGIVMPQLQPRLWRSSLLGSWALRPWLAARLFPEDLNRGVVQVLRIGPVAIVGAPADLASSLALPLIESARSRGVELLFVSMAEQWIGYLMRHEEYEGIDYKATSQFHGPQAGTLFSFVYSELIDALVERGALDSRLPEEPVVPTEPMPGSNALRF